MHLTLRLKLGSQQIDVYPVTRNTTIGRDPDCDVILDNLGVSRKHLLVELMGDKAYIRDLESSNGTFVGAKRITSEELHNGDVIHVGRFSIEVEYRNTDQGPHLPSPLDTIRTDK